MTARRSLLPLAGLGAALLACTVAGLLLDVTAVAGGEHVRRVDLLAGLLAASAALYFAAVRLVLRRAWPRRTAWLVLAVAALLRLLMLCSPPPLSSDVYRYVWDGRVQAAGTNPYRYVPADPALAPLRDAAVYPRINRADYARTIYPPVAQLVFAAVGRLRAGVTGMRLAMVGFEALGVLCMLRLLPLAGLPPERVLLYTWNPLALWSFAGDGHVDALAVGLLGLALLLRARHRDGSAGAAVAAAVLTKFLPLVVAPAFLRGGRAWRPALAGLAVIAAGYGLYAGAGWHVLGFLPSYGQEEGLAGGNGIWLLAGLGALVSLPPLAVPLYLAGVAVALLALSVAILRRPPPANDARALCRDAGALAALATAAASPHYHWYFAWLALPAVVAPSRALLWLATAPLALVVEPVAGDRFLWPCLVYVPAILLLLADLRRAGRPAIPPASRARIPGDTACPLQRP